MDVRTKQANDALRFKQSLKTEAERLAKAGGTTPNRFTNVAVAEKISVLRTENDFRERGACADVRAVLARLDSPGTNAPPRRGDGVDSD